MDKKFFIDRINGRFYLILIIISIIFGLVFTIGMLINVGCDIPILLIIAFVDLGAIGGPIGILIRGDLANVVIDEEGIAKRKLLKVDQYIKWEYVTRAETTRLPNNRFVMIAIEGQDTISKETVTIHVQKRSKITELLKQYLKG